MKDVRNRLDEFEQRLNDLIQSEKSPHGLASKNHRLWQDEFFNSLALELGHLQSLANPFFASWLDRNKTVMTSLSHWSDIPAIPAMVFKEFDWTCLPENIRTHVFYSSGTTGNEASRHWHCESSVRLYEKVLLAWGREHLPWVNGQIQVDDFLFLTPTPTDAPNSSLVHMFGTFAGVLSDSIEDRFLGLLSTSGEWQLPMDLVVQRFQQLNGSVCIFGTAFLWMHVLDYLEQHNLSLQLPSGSMVFETGGYKGKSRAIPKEALHQRLRTQLGIKPTHVLCEYGMSELSSQAYLTRMHSEILDPRADQSEVFRFPPWARCRIVSPETGLEVGIGEAGMVQIIDLANVWSSLSVQTEDVAIRHESGFEIVGRAEEAALRGCSLMAEDLT